MGNFLLEVKMCFWGYSALYNATLHRLTCKMPLLQKNEIKRKRPFFFSWNFHTVFREQIAIFYQIFKSGSSKFFFKIFAIYKGVSPKKIVVIFLFQRNNNSPSTCDCQNGCSSHSITQWLKEDPIPTFNTVGNTCSNKICNWFSEWYHNLFNQSVSSLVVFMRLTSCDADEIKNILSFKR